MTIKEFATSELARLGYDFEDPKSDLAGAKEVLDLLEVFSSQGYSGFSAGWVRSAFNKLAAFEPLTPLTGEDSEWIDRSAESGKPYWQNNRCSRVFKGADGRAYAMEGKVFQESSGACYTSSDSRVYIEFPYTPKTEIVQVP